MDDTMNTKMNLFKTEYNAIYTKVNKEISKLYEHYRTNK